VAVLSHKQILGLHAAAISSSLPSSRAALLGGMDPAFADSLPICASPSSQVLSDLHALNAAERLGDGACPLTIWLENALALVGPRPEEEIFRSALTAALASEGGTLAASAPRGDAITEELARIGRAVLLARGNELKRSLYEVEALLVGHPHHVEARLLRERIKHAVDTVVSYVLHRGESLVSAISHSTSDLLLMSRGEASQTLPSPGEASQTLPLVQPVFLPYPSIDQYRRRRSSFIVREGELRGLMDQLGPGGVVLTGLEGAGKTASARGLFQALAPRYPDLRIAIDLKGTRRGRLSTEAVMERVLRALLPGIPFAGHAGDIATLYHTVLQGQRALLLLDDARDAAQIEPLVPPAGSVLLVTSRSWFALPGISSVTLERLTEDQARALVQDFAPRIDSAMAGEIAELCGGLPLALQLAGGALAMRPDVAPEVYVDRLKDAQARYEQIEAALSVGFELLDPVLQVLWSNLGFLTFDFSPRDAIDVVLNSFFTIDEALLDLVSYGMLERDPKTRRYSMHRAAQRFAISRLSAEDRARRMSRCERLSPPDQTSHHAVSGKALERARGAVRRAWREQMEAAYLHELSGADDSPSVELAKQASDIFGGLNPEARFDLLGELMRSHVNSEDHHRRVYFCDQRLACVSEFGHPYLQVRNHYEVSEDYEALGELDKAIAAVQVGADINRRFYSPWSKKCEDRLDRLRALQEQ
jgi:hypothetical protein